MKDISEMYKIQYPESIVTIKNVLNAKRIISHFSSLLKKGPTSYKDLIPYIQEGSLIDPKIFQHCFTILYPKFKISIEEAAHILKTKIKVQGDRYIDFNDVMAASISNQLRRTNFFSQGRLETLASPLYNKSDLKGSKRIYDESLQMVQTGQKNPDYLFTYDKGLLRYYDLKTGKIKPMQGHLYCTSDRERYDILSEELFNTQKSCYNQLGDPYKKYSILIENLTKDKSLTWIERNQQLQDFYRLNLSTLPNELNPSMIYHMDLSYQFHTENTRISNRMELNTSSLFNLNISRQTLAQILYNSGAVIRTNYKKSEGICSTIVKHIEELEETP